jgi:hypothetical protein
MKRKDNQGNPTYVRDDVGFLIVTFQHRLPMTSKPFIIPNQVTQVLFSNHLKKLGWKVVLQKEAHSRREVADLEEVFITTIVELGGLNVQMGLPPLPSTPSLIGAIKLFEKDNLLACAQF